MRTLVVVLSLLFLGCDSGNIAPPLAKEASVVTEEELTHQREMDLRVIKALADAGSDLAKAHRLEHHFVCATADEAEPIVAWGTSNGFVASPVERGEYEGQSYAYFDLIKPTIPTIENVFADSRRMLEVAKVNGAKYDGWGCPVVK